MSPSSACNKINKEIKYRFNGNRIFVILIFQINESQLLNIEYEFAIDEIAKFEF